MAVFISGASSGLGRALAQHYAAQGAILGLWWAGVVIRSLRWPNLWVRATIAMPH